jgi:glucosyl-dolichyl phosphate glucuronosyltransferase
MTAIRSDEFVSIVICTCSLDNYDNLTSAITSILDQPYPQKEILIVVDGDQPLFQKILSEYGMNPTIRTYFLKENQGVSAARNAGIKAAKGEIIAFLDDDAVAGKTWLENLLKTYREAGAIAVGGKILPVWVGREPAYLSAELYWLVGATHDGFAEEKVVEVRNAFGPNMSFRSEVFRTIGLFNHSFGFSGNSRLQAEEPELALRMRQKFSKGVHYNPDAIVYHKIPTVKTKVGGLLKRSFFQGYSKSMLNRQYASCGAMTSERSYLGYLLFRCIPRRALKFYHLSEIKKTGFLTASIACVGFGYIYGYLKKRYFSDTI